MGIGFRTARWIGIGSMALLCACGGGSGGGAASTATAPQNPGVAYGVSLSNAEIATQLYADSARTPSGFYSDPPPSGINYVATFHLKNADLGVVQSATQELCSNDWNQAYGWSEQAANAAPVYANLVATDGNARFFEFDRLRPGQPAIYQRARVYQCSYLDRAGAALNADSGSAGVLNQRPINAIELRQLSEYLWSFTYYNNFGNAVLASSGDLQAGSMRHSLVIASLQSSATPGGCDRFDVIAWRHVVDATTGALTRAVNTLWSFGARRSAGVTETCTP